MTGPRLVLGIDTAGRFGSVALAENGTARAWEPLQPGEHSRGISTAAERILRGRNLEWRDLSAVAVSGGPGSFTGLRIGLAWAKGVCFGSRAKLILVPAHDANAYRHRGEAAMIATVLQGERGQSQAALWSGGTEMTCLWGPESVPEGELAARLRAAADSRSRADGRGPREDSPIGIAGPDLKPELRLALESAGLRVLDPGAPPAPGAARGSPLPAAAAVAELGDRKLLAGEEADLSRSAPAYGRAPNARKPAS